ETDVLLQTGRVAGGGHPTDDGTANRDREEVQHLVVDVAAELFTLDVDAYELLFHTLGFDLREGRRTHEVGLLFEIDHPRVVVTDLEGIVLVPHVRTEGEDAAFDAPDVT